MPLAGDDDANVNLMITVPSGRCFVVTCWAFDTIDNLKAKIEDKEGIPRAQQVLLHEGRVLQNYTLRYLGMHEGEVIVVATASPEATSSSSSSVPSSTVSTTTRADRLLSEVKALRLALQTVQHAAYVNGMHDILFIDGDEQGP
jgi:hypothetical protein